MPKRVSAPDRRLGFANAYVANGLNGVAAARAAGYTGTDASLAVQASKLLRDPEVQKVLALAARRQEVTTDEVLGVLVSQMRGTAEDFLEVDDETGEPRLDLLKAKRKGLLHLVKEIDQDTVTYEDERRGTVTERKVKVKLYDRQTATVHVAKILGMYVERREITKVRPGSMDDDTLIQQLQDLGIPQDKWPPGVLRRYQSKTRKVESKEKKK